ncbi:MAG: sodium:calcium antiporter [Burkholderiales bacterium]
MESLGTAVVVFLVSAACVVTAGIGLARYGDDLAESTGWGKLWVGTLLVGIATSLPEVTVNISAVWLEKSPGLALGNVFGADMMNVFVLGCVALAFGVGNLFGGQGRDTELLILLGLLLVALALAFGVIGDVKLGPTSLGTLLILAAYLVGMRRVYKAGQTHMHLEDVPAPTGSARKAWIGFLVSVAVVIFAGRYLASSADAIAEASGISASFIGVLLVSIVTTLPEGSVTVAATLRRSYGIAMGNVFGSNAFNVTILFFSDLFSPVPLLTQMQAAHYAAALGALALMALGYLVWKGVQRPALGWARALAPAIPAVYLGALYAVYSLAHA